MNGQPPYNPYQQGQNPYGQQPNPYGQYQQPYYQPPRFDFGWVFSNGFRIFFKNMPTFLLMAVLVFAPLIIYGLTLDYPDIKEHTFRHGASDAAFEAIWQTLRFVIALAVAGILLQPIISSAVIYATVEDLSGRRPSFGKSLGIGLRRMLPSLAVSIVVFVLTMVGVLGLIVGALVVACMCYVAVPASVIEQKGIWNAVTRSWELTKGFRWWIFLLTICVGMMTGLVNTVLEMVLVDKDPTTQLIAQHSWGAYKWLHITMQMIQSTIGASMAATAYVHMRTLKDGVGATDLAKVFE